ncbi:MAG TPA: NAD(P)-dependent oxidoreductase [Solirubrobacteraceae bacterium]|nr:NAD(P)-dependent oxidoreductase [Solirubrobacteraceae bacterium]
MLAWVFNEELRERLAPQLEAIEVAVIPARPAQDADLQHVEALVPPFDPQVLGDVLPQMGALRLIQVLSAGVDWIDGLVPPGVTLCNARGSRDVAVAEWVVAAILHDAQDLGRADAQRRAGVWDPWTPREVAGTTALIVGHGAIGRALQRRLQALEMDVVGVTRSGRDDTRATRELPDLLPHADVVVLLAPLTDETRGLAGAGFLGAMRPGALLVNAGRGALVDTDALLAALHAGRLRAALDVTDPEPLPPGHPLWEAPGLLLTPHQAGDTERADQRALVIVRDQLQRLARGEPLHNVVG